MLRRDKPGTMEAFHIWGIAETFFGCSEIQAVLGERNVRRTLKNRPLTCVNRQNFLGFASRELEKSGEFAHSQNVAV